MTFLVFSKLRMLFYIGLINVSWSGISVKRSKCQPTLFGLLFKKKTRLHPIRFSYRELQGFFYIMFSILRWTNLGFFDFFLSITHLDLKTISLSLIVRIWWPIFKTLWNTLKIWYVSYLWVKHLLYIRAETACT